jgi:hypothetical protein
MISSLACMKPIQRHQRLILTLSAILLFALGVAGPAEAAAVTDGTNDFLPTFTGTHDASLDIQSFSATFDGSLFHLAAVENGPIAAFQTGQFVIGFNRGVGANNFGSIGHGGVTFDSTVTLSSAGVLGGNILNLASVIANISGNGFTIDVPVGSLPGLGGALPTQFTMALWSKDTSQAGTGAIADFAPDNSNLSVPEPLSLSLFGSGLAGLLLTRGRRSKLA